jgi:exosortase D (VPLPA-CTERM-specific)
MTVSCTSAGSTEVARAERRPDASELIAAAFAIACVMLVSLTARDGLVNLVDRWLSEEEYGYGLLAAALVPLLLWRRLPLVRGAGGAHWPGLAIVVAAQTGSVMAALGESYFIEQIAFAMSLLGVALVTFGARAARVLLPLTVLLLLAVPLPYTLQAIITIKLQLISTDLGVAVIKLMEIPVFAEGNLIDLGHYKLQVAEACSGLRYLLPLTCTSFLFAYLCQAPLWKRAVVFASATPLTILLNGFRIAFVAVLVDRFGTGTAEGFLHEFEGWIVFMFGALLLGLEVLALRQIAWPRPDTVSRSAPHDAGDKPAKPQTLGLAAALTLLACVAALAVTTSVTSALQSAPIPARERFADFPSRLDSWSGQPDLLDTETLGSLKATDSYLGDFNAAPGAPPVNFFVAYYDSLGKGAAIHSPRVCLPGAGWEFAAFEERDFGELAPGVRGTYNSVIIQKGERKILMYYWYQQRERRTASEFSMKYYILADSVSLARKDGALVRLYTPIAGEGQAGETAASVRLASFAQAMLPLLPRYLPQ